MSVDANFGGNYTCLVTNLAGRNTSSVTLYIEPYITQFPTRYLEIQLSDTARFSCDAEGYPTPNVYWWKGTQMAVVSPTGNLTFISVIPANGGTFVCEAAARTRNRELTTARAPDSTLAGKCDWI
jgi:hypothetical protein